jgi:hypothetical protein
VGKTSKINGPQAVEARGLDRPASPTEPRSSLGARRGCAGADAGVAYAPVAVSSEAAAPAPEPRVSHRSSLALVYPFVFEDDQFGDLVRRVNESAWNVGKLRVWEPRQLSERDLLEHVARHLGGGEGSNTARWWRMRHEALSSPHGLRANNKWLVDLPRRASLPVQIEGVDLALFNLGVGLVCFTVSVRSESVADWLDLGHYLRFARRRGRVAAIHVLNRRGFDPETRTVLTEEWFPDPFGRGSDMGAGTFADLVEIALLTATADADERWWRDVFVPGQLLPYTTLFVDGVAEGDVGDLLKRARTHARSRQDVTRSPTSLAPEDLLQIGETQWFHFTLSGGGLLAVNGGERAAHLGDEQFLVIFLLALYQRFFLTKLMSDIGSHWFEGEEDARVQAFRRIHESLLDFTARGYAAQLMQRPLPHRCYLAWQRKFQIERLYREVSDATERMHDYVQDRWRERESERQAAQSLETERQARRFELAIGMLAVAIGIPSLVLAFLGINIRGLTAGGGISLVSVWMVSTGALALGIATLALLWYRATRRRVREAAVTAELTHRSPSHSGAAREG